MYKKIQLEKNKLYSWCSCGLSAKAPLCDGAHKGTGLASFKFTVESNGEYKLCMCRKTNTPPFCDGSQDKCVGTNEDN